MKTIFIASAELVKEAKVYFKGEVVVRWVKDKFIAHQRFCPHQNADLNAALVSDDLRLQCPMHPIKFCMESGKSNVQKWAIKVYETLVENNQLFIKINDNETIVV
ncbi:Rieske 2Fe-2S domain-containing protein [Runella sp. SP2]|uniref:Rieske (2Fe-2S) protein n=1 Tax=Runella sp. SP2 TaxID=2268026 RepID=UPI000F07CEC7|nr:Rieske 2Fe-2S domain-containing protein [Runella sp. SP2]AYQ31031.1 hypothetical protein DTQ70_02040 [Runella sp. SP2]